MNTDSYNKIGFPYYYGNSGPEKDIIDSLKEKKLSRILVVAMLGTIVFPGTAMAVTGKKAASEATRSAACAASGACATLMLQKAQCGDMKVATAAFCGFVFAQCIEKTASLISDS